MNLWDQRAAAAEASVCRRSLRRLWSWPAAHLARTAHPPTLFSVVHHPLLYWWQAHVADAVLDAELRDPHPTRRRILQHWPMGTRVANWGRWTNRYYDDIAWFGLFLERLDRTQGWNHSAALSAIDRAFATAWYHDDLGGFPWRRGDEFRNAPANGPAAILLARRGRVDAAERTVEWINARLIHPVTGLVRDGVRPGVVHKEVYTYNQGTMAGAELELLRHGRGDADRLARLVTAIDDTLCIDGVLPGDGGGDRGLFAGICARYLSLVATDLPDLTGDLATSERAARIVLSSAEAAWRNRVEEPHGGVWFGPDWRVPAQVPTAHDRLGGARSPAQVSSAAVPERDLSVQVGGWLLMEAAARLGSVGQQ